ncbi:MAG: hypothetical protein V1729_04205 [Candidatus Woesearchaeota archaeon]
MYDERRKNYYLTLSVANELVKWGYRIADSEGKLVEEPKRDVIGLFRIKDTLLGRIGFTEGEHVGNIWLDNRKTGAKPDSCWIVEKYDNAGDLSSLMQKLGREYKVHIRQRKGPIASSYEN